MFGRLEEAAHSDAAALVQKTLLDQDDVSKNAAMKKGLSLITTRPLPHNQCSRDL
jgi:hypothetical protein